MGLLPNGFSVGALFLVFALLMVITVATDTFIGEELHPHSRFWMLFLSTAIAGLCASILVEHLNLRLLDN